MCEVSSLKDRCVTITLKRNQWSPKKWDKEVTKGVEDTAGVKDVGKYTKQLLKGNKDLKNLQSKFGEVYKYVQDHSLPWMADGVRIIPSSELIDFTNEVGKLKSEAMGLVTQLYNNWSTAVQEDAHRMGSLFNPDDYPTADEMAACWAIRLVIAPISDSADFRVDVGEEMKQALDKELQNVEAQATEHVVKMLMDPIKAMAEKLSVPKGEAGSVFRDTLVTNLKDAASRALKLNINDNENIEKTCHQVLSVLDGLDAQDLRDSDGVRASVASDMRQIQSKLAAYFPRG